MRIYLKKQNFCKRGLVATFEFIKLFDALSVKKVAEGGSAVLEEDWIPLSLEAKRISLSSDLLKLKRKELEELVDSVRNGVSLELYSQFSRVCINNTRFC